MRIESVWGPERSVTSPHHGAASRHRSHHIADGSATLERIVASVALLLVGFRSQWHMGLTTGYLLALVLLPLTLPSLASFRWAKLLVVALGACLAYGLVVSTWSSDTHIISSQARTQAVSLHVGIVASVILVLWARTLMPDGAIAIVMGLGAFVSVGTGLTVVQDWKFGYAMPATLMALGAASLRGGRPTTLLVLCGLGTVTLFADARSLFTTYVLTAGLLLWSTYRGERQGAGGRWPAVALVVLALFVVYKLADYVVLHGLLGPDAQRRSIEDAARSGSTLLGGRPELAVTYDLMRDHFSGYGLGVLPNTHDVAVGNTALFHMGLQPTQNGFSEYMFGRQQFELHSVFGDLWADFGIVGLLVSGLLVVFVLWTLSSAIVGHQLSVLVLFLACYTGWNIVSSPLWSAEPTLILFLGLAFPPLLRDRGSSGPLNYIVEGSPRIGHAHVREQR